MFISNAYAADAPVGGAGGTMELIFMLVIFGLIFYFMIFRPQSKRVKEHKNLMSQLSKGDEILTQGGLVGKIAKVADDKDFISISISEGNEVTVKKGAVTAVLPKGTMKNL